MREAFYRLFCSAADGDHVFVQEVEADVRVPLTLAWLPDHVVCLCGGVTWGEMNARLRAEEAP